MFIAEAGHNWRGILNTAKSFIELTSYTRADYIKFQLYDIDKIKKPGDTNYEELKQSQLSRDDLFELYCHSRKCGIKFMCSVFDLERLGWYMEFDPDYIKVASRSIYDKELMKAIVSTDKPVIASLGAWKEKKFPPYKFHYLFCKTRRDILRDGFSGWPGTFCQEQCSTHYCGFSDHTIGLEWAKRAINDGALIIEKHITLNKNWAGWDQPASILPHEINDLLGERNAHRN
jgi:N-acetylneuraminate synthase/N,N'-diacetyllegionaminate synthase